MGLSSSIMNDICLDQNTSYNLRAGVTVTRRNIRRNSTIGSVLWGKLPSHLINAGSLYIFKHRLKSEPQKLFHVKYEGNL